MIKAVIFDWSGVLTDDFAACHRAAAKIFKKEGLDAPGIEKFRKIFNLPFMDFYRSEGIKMGMDEMRKIFFSEYDKSGGNNIFPFVTETLDYLKNRGIQMGILSSHPHDVLVRELKHNGLAVFFHEVMGSAYDKRKVIRDFIKRFDAKPGEMIFVGDMVHDVEAGKTAGIMTGAVLSGYHTKKRLEDKEPNIIMNDIRDLKSVMDGVFI